MITNHHRKNCIQSKAKSWLRIGAFAMLSLFIATASYAQFKISPIIKPGKVASHNNPGARTLSVAPLELPFFDDFSVVERDSMGSPTGRPNSLLWQNSETVSVNGGMGINPPTINVATFDGLNERNLPYEPSQVFLNGLTDTLTSQEINLVVVPGDTNSVYLSFFYQWKGNGEAPDPADYLQLDFKDAGGKPDSATWTTDTLFQQGDSPDPTLFIYVMKKIKRKYQYENFQFRFIRYGRKSGPFDTWNLDYIYLNSGRDSSRITEDYRSFPDLAVASELSPLFKPYYDVPLEHFFEKKSIDSVSFDVQNLNDSVTNSFYTSTVLLKNYTSDDTTQIEVPLRTSEDLGSINGLAMGPFQRVKAKLDTLPDTSNPSQFNPQSKKIDLTLNVIVRNVDKDAPPKFPVNLRVNDTISRTYTLADYYAYDDGTAEYSAYLTNAGISAVVMFEMITAEPDVLQGFDIYFPDYAITNNLTANVFAYTDLTRRPSRTTLLSIKPKGLNKFTRITFEKPLLVRNKFYIGWTEPGQGTVKVGLDYSNDTASKIFKKSGDTWLPATNIKGSLMIRPLFGDSIPGIITGLPPDVAAEVIPPSLYPNPNSGTFFIRGEYTQLSIINTIGQPVYFQHQMGDDGQDSKITLNASPGLYIVQFKKGNTIVNTQKIIVR